MNSRTQRLRRQATYSGLPNVARSRSDFDQEAQRLRRQATYSGLLNVARSRSDFDQETQRLRRQATGFSNGGASSLFLADSDQDHAVWLDLGGKNTAERPDVFLPPEITHDARAAQAELLVAHRDHLGGVGEVK
jgi:hypothetical protein